MALLMGFLVLGKLFNIILLFMSWLFYFMVCSKFVFFLSVSKEFRGGVAN